MVEALLASEEAHGSTTKASTEMRGEAWRWIAGTPDVSFATVRSILKLGLSETKAPGLKHFSMQPAGFRAL